MSRLKTDAIRNTSASADALTFDTNGNTKIADNEELQIGTGGDLVLKHDGGNSYIKDSGTGDLIIQGTSNGAQFKVAGIGTGLGISTYAQTNADAGVNIEALDSTYGQLRFVTAGSERMRIMQDGDVKINDGNLVISTSGHGIDFSATSNSGGTMSNELLADYEEGTWTPTLYKGNTEITSVSNRYGTYTRVGRMLFLSFYWYASSHTSFSDSGYWTMWGLPFAITTHSDAAYNSLTGGYYYINGVNGAGDEPQSTISAGSGNIRWQNYYSTGLLQYGPHGTENWASGQLEWSAHGWLTI